MYGPDEKNWTCYMYSYIIYHFSIASGQNKTVSYQKGRKKNVNSTIKIQQNQRFILNNLQFITVEIGKLRSRDN